MEKHQRTLRRALYGKKIKESTLQNSSGGKRGCKRGGQKVRKTVQRLPKKSNGGKWRMRTNWKREGRWELGERKKLVPLPSRW